jgi:hypothetical protein
LDIVENLDAKMQRIIFVHHLSIPLYAWRVAGYLLSYLKVEILAFKKFFPSTYSNVLFLHHIHGQDEFVFVFHKVYFTSSFTSLLKIYLH